MNPSYHNDILTKSMTKPEFNKCIVMLRSDDSMTYEEVYHWLQGHIKEHLDELIRLMLAEDDPKMRSKFVELVGDSQDITVIPYIEKELQHHNREVRAWAYNSLMYFEEISAIAIAKKFKENNPEEDFLY